MSQETSAQGGQLSSSVVVVDGPEVIRSMTFNEEITYRLGQGQTQDSILASIEGCLALPSAPPVVRPNTFGEYVENPALESSICLTCGDFF